MKLELNTNGAWRTVLSGLQDDTDETLDALTAAGVLAEISNPGRERKRGITWRLVDETTGRVVARCDAGGWTEVER